MMYPLDPSAGRRWLKDLRSAPISSVGHVVDVRPAQREAEDGSTEIWAIVVLRDSVMQMPADQRRMLLASLEAELKRIVVGDAYVTTGRPLVSFRTESDEQAQNRA